MIVPHSMNSDLCLDRLIEDICRSTYALVFFQYVTNLCYSFIQMSIQAVGYDQTCVQVWYGPLPVSKRS